MKLFYHYLQFSYINAFKERLLNASSADHSTTATPKDDVETYYKKIKQS